MILTGVEFKEKYKTTYFKLLPVYEVVDNFKFKYGLNKIKGKITFGKNPKFKKGFSFTTLENFHKWRFFCKNYVYVREVVILDESLIDISSKIFETDKFFLKEKMLIWDFFTMMGGEKFILDLLKKNPYIIKYLKNKRKYLEFAILEDINVLKIVDKKLQNYNICKIVIQQRSCAILEHIRDDLKTFEICDIAVKILAKNFIYVKKELQTYELCVIGVKYEENSLKYIREDLLDYELYKLAVSNFGSSLQYIIKEDKTYELCKLALKNNCFSFEYVDKEFQDHELFNLILNCPDYCTKCNLFKYLREDLQTIEICKIFVKGYRKNIQYVRKDLLNYELFFLVAYYGNLEYLEKEYQDYNLCYISVFRRGDNIRYVREDLKDYKICYLSVLKDGYNLRYVREELQDYNMCYMAVSKNRLAYEFVRKDLINKEIFELLINNFINFE